MNLCMEWVTSSPWTVHHRRPRWSRPLGRPEYTEVPRVLILSAHAQQVLGANGVGRFREFWSYKDGWDFGGGGKALSLQSVRSFECFVGIFSAFGEKAPSLFLSPDGHLVLAWEDANGERVEVEFGERDAILFLASEDDGRNFDLERESGALVEAIPH